MTKQLILLVLACGLLLGTTGCRLLNCLFCPRAMCGPQYGGPMLGPACGPPCGPSCGPEGEGACGPAAAARYEPACGMASAPACDGPYGPAGAPCGPLTWLFRLLDGDGWYGDGCGEMYCGDFCSDPPDCRDPCDRWGNYTGCGVREYDGASFPGTAVQQTGVAAAPRVVQPPRAIRR
jgi:hypothetical protein